MAFEKLAVVIRSGRNGMPASVTLSGRSGGGRPACSIALSAPPARRWRTSAGRRKVRICCSALRRRPGRRAAMPQRHWPHHGEGDAQGRAGVFLRSYRALRRGIATEAILRGRDLRQRETPSRSRFRPGRWIREPEMNIRVAVPEADIAQARREAGWTELRTRVAFALFAGGMSDTQVACLIGGVTRNAVIGKRNRGGCSTIAGPAAVDRPKVKKGPARGPQRKHERKPRVVARAPLARVRPIPPRIDDLAIPLEQRRSLFDLNDHCCRWPVGDPAQPDFFFCGASVTQIEGERRQPYCASHAHRARPGARAALGGAARAAAFIGSFSGASTCHPALTANANLSGGGYVGSRFPRRGASGVARPVARIPAGGDRA